MPPFRCLLLGLVTSALLPAVPTWADPPGLSPQWTRTYATTVSDDATAVAVDPTGGLVIATGGVEYAYDDRDVRTRAYTTAGDLAWSTDAQLPGDERDSGLAVAVDPSRGQVYVLAEAQAPIRIRTLLLAYDRSGRELWRVVLERKARDVRPGQLRVEPTSGTVYLTAEDQRPGGPETFVVLTALSPDGAVRWQRGVNPESQDQDTSTGLAVAPDGGSVYVGGYSYGTRDLTTGWLYAFTAAGGRRWTTTVDPTGFSDVDVQGLAISGDGDQLAVVGTSPQAVVVAGFGAADGRLRWAQPLGAPGFGGHEPVVDPRTGAVYVLGDGQVRALSSRGARLWTWQPAAPGAGVTGLAVDPSSGALLLGQTQDGPGQTEVTLTALDRSGRARSTSTTTLGGDAYLHGPVLDAAAGTAYLAGTAYAPPNDGVVVAFAVG